MADEQPPTLQQKLAAKLRFSIATWASIVVGATLLALLLVTWGLYSLDASRVAWGIYMTPTRAISLFLLWSAAIGVTYVTVRVWMHDVPLSDHRISSGWNAGTDVLAKHGVSITDLPCFVVLGCPSRFEQDLLVGQRGYSPVHDTTEATPAIDWHLTKEYVLLFCRDVGVYGRLLQQSEALLQQTATQDPSVTSRQSDAVAATPVVNNIGAEQPAGGSESLRAVESAGAPDAENQQTETALQPETAVATETAIEPAAEGSPEGEPAPQPDATSELLRSIDRASQLVSDAQRVDHHWNDVGHQDGDFDPSLLSSAETAESQEQLAQLCNRLRSQRFPNCAINGTLVMVDSRYLSLSDKMARNMGHAIRDDLQMLSSQLGASSPVTMVVCETESEADYAELFRRTALQPNNTDDPLLGQVFDPETTPDAPQLSTLADQTIQQLQSKIQTLFRVPGTLAQPRNHHLVRLLIRGRKWRQSLRTVIVESCSDDDSSDDGRSIVSGLFIAALGRSPMVRPHLDAVFKRMLAQQHFVGWTPAALAQEKMSRRVVTTLMATTLMLVIVLLIQLLLIAF